MPRPILNCSVAAQPAVAAQAWAAQVALVVAAEAQVAQVAQAVDAVAVVVAEAQVVAAAVDSVAVRPGTNPQINTLYSHRDGFGRPFLFSAKLAGTPGQAES